MLSQEDFLAKQYFEDGEFEKAKVFLEKLVDKNPRRTDFTERLIACYQELEQYDKAEELLHKIMGQGIVYPTGYIELGRNYALQGMEDKAIENYNLAISQIEKHPNYGYGVGYKFQQYVLLDYALKAFSRAMELNPAQNYDYQIARIYGEQGNIEEMFGSYLKMISDGTVSTANVLRNINDFITSDASNPNNLKFKRILLQKAQKTPDVIWNELLSWLFVQQEEYTSAFGQERAIYRRSEERSLQRLQGLGKLALDKREAKVASDIYNFIVENSSYKREVLDAQLNLIGISLLDAGDKELLSVEKTFSELIQEYGFQMETLQLQIAYAKFLTFNRNNPGPAIEIMEKCLELPLNNYGAAYIKNTLGDILVFDQKFNRALIYYSQIQKNLKNDVLGQEARFKVAQTSFYKGDFDWALTQLKVLRSATSQLIANDAMQLSLLISDNSLEDSTQVALKKYARASFLNYQNNKAQAVALLNDILDNHKGEKIEDEALLKQGQILTELKQYGQAEFNYLKIVEFHGQDILADDAHFALAELYNTVLKNPEKAKFHYEQIVFNHQDSYYFPQARKRYRALRGDSIK
ncbi:hypothetical protein GCM10007383_35200 [Arenibacter certesii]|uniref:Tetratricopeptide repeat protein n=1 Tax=Arenibacter certesii TaxID=228955 RepID=A0A918J5I4_9FLAO|nr:hypothetical protein GCM10007383_35200 [Arenibacter certesii]